MPVDGTENKPINIDGEGYCEGCEHRNCSKCGMMEVFMSYLNTVKNKVDELVPIENNSDNKKYCGDCGTLVIKGNLCNSCLTIARLNGEF